MMLAFCLLAALPAITAGSDSVSSKETKTFHPKPSAWMLKPVSENHSLQMPTPKALSANSDTVYVIHTFYSAAGGVCDDAILSRIAYANFHCYATSLTTSMMYICSSGEAIFFSSVIFFPSFSLLIPPSTFFFVWCRVLLLLLRVLRWCLQHLFEWLRVGIGNLQSYRWGWRWLRVRWWCWNCLSVTRADCSSGPPGTSSWHQSDE